MWARIDDTMARQIRRVRPIRRADADATTRALADQIERDFGAFVPPFALHAIVPLALAACWTMLRETLVTVSVDRLRKEAVASAVSRLNDCTYCVDAHTAALHALGDATTADALATAATVGAAAPALAPLITWALATRTPDAPILRTPPFTTAEAPELVAMAFCFHYINRLVALFLTASPLPFASPRLKGWARRALSPILSGGLRKSLTPGDALAFLPATTLPADLAWAENGATLGPAFARAAAAFERVGAETLSEDVRALVRTRLDAWQGADPGLGQGWIDDAIAPLRAADRPAARLALLAAFAPHQVSDEVIAEFRRVHPSDANLVGAAAWTSFTTARRIARWLA
jgi:AhpD family alkylhydroperoxidase